VCFAGPPKNSMKGHYDTGPLPRAIATLR
jgi:hypothetical protein